MLRSVAWWPIGRFVYCATNPRPIPSFFAFEHQLWTKVMVSRFRSPLRIASTKSRLFITIANIATNLRPGKACRPVPSRQCTRKKQFRGDGRIQDGAPIAHDAPFGCFWVLTLGWLAELESASSDQSPKGVESATGPLSALRPY